jgi:hypothetical protein
MKFHPIRPLYNNNEEFVLARSAALNKLIQDERPLLQSTIDFARVFCYNNKSEEIYCFFGKERLKI